MENSAPRVAKWKAEIETLKARVAGVAGEAIRSWLRTWKILDVSTSATADASRSCKTG